MLPAVEKGMTYFRYEDISGGGGAANIMVFILMSRKISCEGK